MKLIAVVSIILSSLFLSYGLFRGKLNKVSGQLNSYESADYMTIYVLNYGERLNNECLYPDSDVQIFRDREKASRLTVSCVMCEDKTLYNLGYLSTLSGLNPGEISVSKNVADSYDLKIGDYVYAEYSYSSTMMPLLVADITKTEYDYMNPYIDNNIGVVFLGYDHIYSDNTKSKYIVFAQRSKTEELSKFPQIINTVISKSENKKAVIKQGFGALLFVSLFTTVAVIISQIVFFSESKEILFRCFLKGMKKSLMIVIPFLERILLCFCPCLVFQSIASLSMPKSVIAEAYQLLPISICALFCIYMLALDTVKLKRQKEG